MSDQTPREASSLPFDPHAFACVEDANDFLLAVLDCLDCGLIALRPNGEALYWSRATEALTGVSAASAFDDPPGERLYASSSLGTGGLKDAVEQILETGRWAAELDLYPPDAVAHSDATSRGAPSTPMRDHPGVASKRLYVERTGLYDPTGELVAIAGVAMDVTAEADLMGQLRASNERLFNFARTSAESFEGPLRGIEVAALGLSSLAALDERSERWIGHMVTSTDRLSVMVSDLLAYASLAGTQTGAEQVNLNDALNEGLGAISAVIEDTGTEIQIGRLPTIQGDRSGMRQVFQNLMQNAIKFRRDTIPCQVHVDAEAQGASWHLTFADNGMGIDPAQRERVLQPFRRLNPDLGGTGLGLTFCRQIIEQHDGEISLSGNGAGGTTVHITIPAYGGSQLVADRRAAANLQTERQPYVLDAQEPADGTLGHLAQAPPGSHDRVRPELRADPHLLYQLLVGLVQNAGRYAMTVATLDNDIVMFNRAAEESLGYTAAELIGRHKGVDLVAEESASAVETGISTAASGKAWPGTVMVRHRDGQVFPVRVNAAPLKGPGAQPVAIVGLGYDVSFEVRLASQLEQSNQRLREFASATAHDLAEPVRTIRRFSELLAESGDWEHDSAQLIETVASESAALDDHISEVLGGLER